MTVSELNAIGVQVRADANGNLRIKAAAGLLTPHLLDTITRAKPALLAELSGELVNFVNFNSHALAAATVQTHPESEVHGAWLLHFIDDAPLELHVTPAVSHAEVIAWYPLAVAAESIEVSTECR